MKEKTKKLVRKKIKEGFGLLCNSKNKKKMENIFNLNKIYG